MSANPNLEALFRAALLTGAPLPGTALAAAVASALNAGGISAMMTYSRAELSATQAATLWDRYAHAGCVDGGDTPASWQARRALRPESHPERLSAADVAGWPAEMAQHAAELLRGPRGCGLVGGVAEALMGRPELATAMTAAFAAPGSARAHALVAALGEQGGLTWPDAYFVNTPSAADTPRQELLRAIQAVGSLSAPAELAEFAALTWDSPACLSILRAGGLSARAAGRVVTRWLIPAVATAAGTAITLSRRSIALLPQVDKSVAGLLADTWVVGGLIGDLDAAQVDELAAAFLVAGVPLVQPILGQPVCTVRDLSLNRRVELITEVAALASDRPAMWDALGTALASTCEYTGTWGELLDALDAMTAAPMHT